MIEWDDGNWPKCGKHGVSQAEIAEVFAGDPMVSPDHAHSSAEERFHAIGETGQGRFVFIAFTRRLRDGAPVYRPPGTCIGRRLSSMSKPDRKPLPRLLSDEDAERFVEEADLTEFDLAGMVRLSELERRAKNASIHLRLPQAQLDEIKAEAQKRGVPYQRFMRELMQRGMATLGHS